MCAVTHAFVVVWYVVRRYIYVCVCVFVVYLVFRQIMCWCVDIHTFTYLYIHARFVQSEDGKSLIYLNPV